MTPEVKQRIDQIRQGIVPEGYKRTKVGIAPAEWEERTLGSIYAERKEPGNNELPILTVSIHSGVSDGELDEDEIGKKVRRIEDRTQYRKALSGDLVFNMMRAWQGAIGVVRADGMVSPAYIVATPNKSVYPLFMDYYMKTPQMVNTIHRASYGLTDFRLRLYWDSFAPIRCAIPSVAEQQKIAAILTTQDKVVELKEKLLAEKQRQKKFLMQQLLTGRKRMAGFTDKWCSTQLREVCKLTTKHADGITRNYVSVENMTANLEGEINFGVQAENVSGIIYHAGDTLVGNIRPYLKKVWKADRTGICSSDVLVFTPTGINADYLHFLIANDGFFSYVMTASKGSKMPRGDKKQMLKMPISLPVNLHEQECIGKLIQSMQDELNLLRQDLKQERKKKKALMQLLLSGIVRINNDNNDG